MAQQMYRVVEAVFEGRSRIERDIGCTWKPEKAAKAELKTMQLKAPKKLLSIQKKT